jgi:hypothetical protein
VPLPEIASRTLPLQLGLRANWRQFSLLVLINAFVGSMVGLTALSGCLVALTMRETVANRQRLSAPATRSTLTV